MGLDGLKEGIVTDVPYLLVDFARLPRRRRRVLDLGCGNGMITLLMAKRYPDVQFVGLEVSSKLCYMAKKNAVKAGISSRFEVINADVKKAKEHIKAESFDVVVMNPPFWQVGKISPSEIRRMARHTDKETFLAFLDTSAFALRNRGMMYGAFSTEHIDSTIIEIERKRLIVKEMQFVHGTLKVNSKRVLIKAVKNASGGVKVLPPVLNP